MIPRPVAPLAPLGAGLVAIAAAAYVIARALHVPITYDEATSFSRYVDADPMALADFATATNHLLNSALTRAAVTVFGSAPWVLRLPNVLAGIAFLAVATAFARRTVHPTIGAAGAVLLATNPYLLDYFALSRGYGLAIGLLSASWLVWLRWWTSPPAAAAPKDLAAAVALSAAAVSASFSVLPAFLALLAISAGRLLWRARPAPRPGDRAVGVVVTWPAVVVWAVLATAFTALVFARERVPSGDAYAPVTVRIAGLLPEEAAVVEVFRYDSTGRLRQLPRRPDGTWNSGPVEDAWTLRVLIPATADRNLALLEVRAGDAVFARTRRSPGPWHVEDRNDVRVLTSTSSLRWRGDAAHRRFVATHTAVTMAALAALLAALTMVARSSVRRGVAYIGEAQALLWATVAVATLLAAPIYLLRRDEQLFFGGSTGVVADTVTSLVQATAYGSPMPPAATGVALWLTLAVVLVPAAAAATAAHSRQTAAYRAAAAMIGLLALSVVQVPVQHAVLQTPFPIGRTALHLLPLVVIGAVLAADAMATRGRWWRRAATTAIAGLAAASLWHGARMANLSHAFDWPGDSAVPWLLHEVLTHPDERQPAPASTRLGVHWSLYPIARYYADRLPPGSSRVEPLVLPGDGLPLDFAYGPPASLPRGGRLVARYDLTGAQLHQLPD